MMIDRRGVLVGGALLALAAAVPAWAKIATGPEIVDLSVTTTRSTKLVLWRPDRLRGVVLFSTGHGSWPERYGQLVALLTANGFAVLAPVHVDSMHYPDRDRFTMQASFGERLADMAATGGYAARAFPGVPVTAAGHSFGTLIALCLGGSLDYIGKFRNPAVRAVLGFSTPGRIPGLIQPSAYATLAVPALIVTGTKDLVPGFVSDPTEHLFPIESAPPGDRFALVVENADHGLVADAAAFPHGSGAVANFMRGYGLGEAKARALLAAFKPMAGDRFVSRKVAL